MDAQTIIVRVSAETAKAYFAAPEQEKKFAEELIEMLFRPKGRMSSDKLRQLAERAHGEASANGLDETKLKEILENE